MSAVLDPHGGALPLPLPAPRKPTSASEAVTSASSSLDPAAVRGAVSDLRGPTRARTGRRGTGFAVVVGVHMLLAWALVSGLAKRVVDVVRAPVEVSIVDVTPPPPPPPKVPKILDAPRLAPPPPIYVPPPEVAPPPAPEAPAAVTTTPEPAAPPVVIAAPAPAPVAAPAEKPAVVRQEISLACPGYQAVLSQGLEDAFDRVGVAGTVRTRLTVRGNQVVEATPVSGPKEYFKFVQSAIRRMHCSAGGSDEVQVTLDVAFAK